MWVTKLKVHVTILYKTIFKVIKVGYSRTNDPKRNECYNEKFLSIKSGCYNEGEGGILNIKKEGRNKVGPVAQSV